MSAKVAARKRRLRLASAAIAFALLVAVSSYGTWGYERHLAIESFPVAGAEIYPEFQFAIEYRKRFDFLPGSTLSLVATDRKGIAEIRSSALSAYDWSFPDLRGTTHVFVADYKPLAGWVKRDSNAEPIAADLN